MIRSSALSRNCSEATTSVTNGRREKSFQQKNYLLVLTKEDAALAYLGVFWEKASKLRNSLSRREFFRRNDEDSDYAKVFALQLNSDGVLDSGLEPQNRERALQFIAAHVLVQGCRGKVASDSSATPLAVAVARDGRAVDRDEARIGRIGIGEEDAVGRGIAGITDGNRVSDALAHELAQAGGRGCRPWWR